MGDGRWASRNFLVGLAASLNIGEMAKYQYFHEVPAWQEAAQVYHKVLDLFQRREVRLSQSFRNQLERAALSISSNIAEGFERATTAELTNFLAIARGSAGEVRSLVTLMESRSEARLFASDLRAIREHAESCTRQLVGWTTSIQKLGFTGSRRRPPGTKAAV
jgi:four helix bundle protein